MTGQRAAATKGKGRGQRPAEKSEWSQPQPVERPVTAGIHANQRTAAPAKKNHNEEFPEFPGLGPQTQQKATPVFEEEEEAPEVVVQAAPKGKGRGKKGKPVPIQIKGGFF